MSEEIASVDALLTANAELRAEIQHRAKIDAEDMHRIQAHAADLRAALDVAMAENDRRRELMQVMERVVEAAQAACEASLFQGRGPLVGAIAAYYWKVQGVK